MPTSYTLSGAFLLGLSFGAITIGRGAPLLIVVLTYIALYQTMAQGFVTLFVYAIGMSIPLIVISSVRGAVGKKIKEKANVSGELADRIIGSAIILTGVYFLYLAFR
ncbi:MAG: hypothetical protein LUQ31_04945 [Methanoregula sp.]|nr:hypothetical protein [Methanoregula sp.]